jgi:hypothetical protein
MTGRSQRRSYKEMRSRIVVWEHWLLAHRSDNRSTQNFRHMTVRKIVGCRQPDWNGGEQNYAEQPQDRVRVLVQLRQQRDTISVVVSATSQAELPFERCTSPPCSSIVILAEANGCVCRLARGYVARWLASLHRKVGGVSSDDSSSRRELRRPA